MDIVSIMTVCAVAQAGDFMYNEREIAKYNTVWPKYSCTETAKVVRKNVSFLDFDMMTRGEGAISYKHTVPAKALKKLFTDPSFLVHMRNVHNWEDAPDLARYLKTLEEENERTNKALKEIEEERAKGKRKPTSMFEYDYESLEDWKKGLKAVKVFDIDPSNVADPMNYWNPENPAGVNGSGGMNFSKDEGQSAESARQLAAARAVVDKDPEVLKLDDQLENLPLWCDDSSRFEDRYYECYRGNPKAGKGFFVEMIPYFVMMIGLACIFVWDHLSGDWKRK